MKPTDPSDPEDVMRKLVTTSLLGGCLVAASAMLVPTGAAAGNGYYQSSRCSGPLARFRPSCRSLRVVRDVVPTDPSVPEPGAAALFALGAGLIAARSRRTR
jgi:hypothetical protein